MKQGSGLDGKEPTVKGLLSNNPVFTQTIEPNRTLESAVHNTPHHNTVQF